MKRLPAFLSVLMLSFPALAMDATAPVKEVMQAVTTNWQELPEGSESAVDYVDYFNEDFLKRLYSQDFVENYRQAAKYPAYEEGGSPFDYDVIAMGQDGCSINDLKIAAAAEKEGVSDVAVTFDNTHCFGDRPADWKPTEVHFSVVSQDGRPVIDDILRIVDGTGESLKKEMKEIAAEGATMDQQGSGAEPQSDELQ
ncbi:MAG: hypothetical protein QHC90_03365 [Shinella sp.]|nr:hypothetical protein [Shinella sp.]